MSEKREYNIEYKQWRKSVLNSYGNKCTKCGASNNLQAHHIKSWRNFPELRFDVNNGQAICEDCHIEIHPYMIRLIKENIDLKIKNKQQNKLAKFQSKTFRKKKFHKFLQRNGFTSHGNVGKKAMKIEQRRAYHNDHMYTKDNPNPNWT